MNKREMRRHMEERMRARLEELRTAEREAELRLVVLRNLIVELEHLLTPPTTTGAPLGEPLEAHNDHATNNAGALPAAGRV